MTEEKTKVLEMLAEGKIEVSEAEKLLGVLSETAKETSSKKGSPSKSPKFLKVQVDSKKDDGKRVNIQVPLALMKAGMKLTSLVPEDSRNKIQGAMDQKGIDFDLNEINPKNLDQLLESLQELEVTIEDDESVRIFCE